jgi:hypothetical protein
VNPDADQLFLDFSRPADVDSRSLAALADPVFRRTPSGEAVRRRTFGNFNADFGAGKVAMLGF